MSGALGARAWDAALRLVGTPFRLHGRDPASGLDCVGLVAAAYAFAGHAPSPVPNRYRLSGPEPDIAARWLSASGAMHVQDAEVGDIGLCDMSHGARRQLHLMLLGPGGAVQAHAGLRRVVISPVPASGVLLGRWRIFEQE
jgi:murein DD-endopeptidase / murein LD-carboxypeptidase